MEVKKKAKAPSELQQPCPLAQAEKEAAEAAAAKKKKAKKKKAKEAAKEAVKWVFEHKLVQALIGKSPVDALVPAAAAEDIFEALGRPDNKEKAAKLLRAFFQLRPGAKLPRGISYDLAESFLCVGLQHVDDSKVATTAPQPGQRQEESREGDEALKKVEKESQDKLTALETKPKEDDAKAALKKEEKKPKNKAKNMLFDIMRTHGTAVLLKKALPLLLDAVGIDADPEALKKFEDTADNVQRLGALLGSTIMPFEARRQQLGAIELPAKPDDLKILTQLVQLLTCEKAGDAEKSGGKLLVKIRARNARSTAILDDWKDEKDGKEDDKKKDKWRRWCSIMPQAREKLREAREKADKNREADCWSATTFKDFQEKFAATDAAALLPNPNPGSTFEAEFGDLKPESKTLLMGCMFGDPGQINELCKCCVNEPQREQTSVIAALAASRVHARGLDGAMVVRCAKALGFDELTTKFGIPKVVTEGAMKVLMMGAQDARAELKKLATKLLLDKVQTFAKEELVQSCGCAMATADATAQVLREVVEGIASSGKRPVPEESKERLADVLCGSVPDAKPLIKLCVTAMTVASGSGSAKVKSCIVAVSKTPNALSGLAVSLRRTFFSYTTTRRSASCSSRIICVCRQEKYATTTSCSTSTATAISNLPLETITYKNSAVVISRSSTSVRMYTSSC